MRPGDVLSDDDHVAAGREAEPLQRRTERVRARPAEAGADDVERHALLPLRACRPPCGKRRASPVRGRGPIKVAGRAVERAGARRGGTPPATTRPLARAGRAAYGGGMAEFAIRLLALVVVFAAAWPLARAAARRAEGAARPEPAALGVALPLRAFARHALGAAAAALTIALAIWTLAAPEIALGLSSDPAPLQRISRPFLASGAGALYLTVWLAGATGAPVALGAVRFGRAFGPPADMALRLLLLIPTTAAAFMLASALAGAFGGDWRTALEAVPSSLLYGLAAEGVSGVFVWAAVLSGLPMTLAAAGLRAGLGARPAALAAALGLALAALPAAFALALLG